MKILFFSSQGQDNLEDACLHGLRSLFGPDCVDYPKKEALYRGYSAREDSQAYARYFTLWHTLDDIPIDRLDIEARLRKNDFDLVIFGSIHRTQAFFQYYEPILKPHKTILLDGEDDPGVHISARKFVYFKREILGWGAFWDYRCGERTRIWRYGRRAKHHNILPISFALPEEKITTGLSRTNKRKIFPTQIVDEELLHQLDLSALFSPAVKSMCAVAPEGTISSERGYLIATETDYYRDLQASRFGVTTRRGGWDSLRHYEIAANGAVICFRDLRQKPPQCAPHGLRASNCLNYSSAQDLLRQIESLDETAYDDLLAESYRWIQMQTTEVRAKEVLDRARCRWA